MHSEITPDLLAHYFDVTGRALEKAKVAPKAEEARDAARAAVALDMASRYFSDAKHFQQKGDLVNAFGALYYAHGWLDAGARLELYDVGGDSTLFTVD